MKFIARHDGEERPVEIDRWGAGYRVRLGDVETIYELVRAGEALHTLRRPDGAQELFVHQRDGNEYRITLAGRTVHVTIVDPLAARRATRGEEAGGEATVKAIMPGRVVRILVVPGDEVRKGAGLLILEAMKMENEIAAPRDGRVAEVHVESGATVEGGAALVTLEEET
ncbi:MAG: biotin/lipoyl-containing protein [Thermoanaerobaculia bacterium]